MDGTGGLQYRTEVGERVWQPMPPTCGVNVDNTSNAGALAGIGDIITACNGAGAGATSASNPGQYLSWGQSSPKKRSTCGMTARWSRL
jgi:hypothetical protein